jgi:hypothetical protein
MDEWIVWNFQLLIQNQLKLWVHGNYGKLEEILKL